MKAIVIHDFGPPEVLRYEEIPTPRPSRGEVLIRVHAATMNRVFDLGVRSGKETRRNIRLPLVPGVDAVGTVAGLGESLGRFKIGDHVAVEGSVPLAACDACPKSHGCPQTARLGVTRQGGDAEFICVPACSVCSVPKELPFPEAAVIMRHGPTALKLISHVAGLKPGEWILVLGAAGNLGHIGIQIAKNLVGAKVIAAAGDDARVQIGINAGADHGVNYNSQDLTAEVLKLTRHHGVDVVYDNIANPRVVPAAIAAMATRGRFVTAGALSGPVVPVNFAEVYHRELTIVGTHGKLSADRPRAFQAAIEGKIKARYDRIFPLSEAVAAHRLLESDRSVGKLILVPIE